MLQHYMPCFFLICVNEASVKYYSTTPNAMPEYNLDALTRRGGIKVDKNKKKDINALGNASAPAFSYNTSRRRHHQRMSFDAHGPFNMKIS
jgi:hypothetical protein